MRRNACLRGSRRGAIARRPACPGGRSGAGRHDGRGLHRHVFPAVDVLVHPHEHLGPESRAAVAGLVEVRDVAGALDQNGQDAQDPVVLTVGVALSALSSTSYGAIPSSLVICG